MTTMQYARAEDLPQSGVAGDGSLDCAALTGTWVNTNPQSRGIVRVVLNLREDALQVRVFGAGENDACDWGEVSGAAFSESVGSAEATAFTALYDFGFMSVHLLTYVVKGVLVIASFTRFQDASGRSSYFAKEFFYRR